MSLTDPHKSLADPTAPDATTAPPSPPSPPSPASGKLTSSDHSASSGQEADKGDAVGSEGGGRAKKGVRFWLIICSLLVATFIAALDLTAAATALPSIAASLNGIEYTWIGNAYSIASTAIIPWSGGLCNVFGRRPVMLAGLAFFLVGSILCGEAMDMSMMIAGRSLQGVGAGMILAGVEIVFADLVPLAERGTYMGAFGATWALAGATGPMIGAATAQTDWRWLFRMNYPATVVIAIPVWAFLTLKTPPGTLREKLGRMDWIGNGLFIPTISLVIIGLTWGGNEYPWKSAHVLAPLIIGVVGVAAWVVLEYKWVEHPTVPFRSMTNRTTWMGFATTFIHGLSSQALYYYWPSWFQAVKGYSPIRSAVDYLPVELTVTPFSVVAGFLISRFGVYLPENYFAWVLMTLGPGLMAIMHSDARVNLWATLPIPMSAGIGTLYSAATFPVLAPLPPSMAGQALAFQAFCRSLGGVFGITIGSTTLANELAKKLPREYVDSLAGGAAGAYADIPNIKYLAEPLRTQVRVAFGESIRIIWIVLIPFGAVGLAMCAFMRQIELQKETDEKWGLKDKPKDAEQAAAADATGNAEKIAVESEAALRG